MEFSRVEQQSFKTSELLQPLSKVEQAMFLHSLQRICKESQIVNRQALCVMFLDRLHVSHQDELATITSCLVNKFMNEPFRGDRVMLKKVLEAIMGAITMGEKLMDGEDDSKT